MLNRLFIPLLLHSALAVAAGALATLLLWSGVTVLYLGALMAAAGGLALLFYPILRRSLENRLREDGASRPGRRDRERLDADFVTSMSHELRTPLNSIIGFTGIILQGMSGEINRRQRDQLERVLDSAKRLLAMISDIIDIARIDSGATTPCLTNFFPKDAIQDSIAELRRENSHIFNKIDIMVDIPPELEFHTDAKKLVRSVLNIVLYVVECGNIENITITASRTGRIATIAIGTTNPVPDRLSLERFATSMQLQGMEPPCRELAGGNIRMHLTRKMVASLPGGNLVPGSDPDDGTLLRLEFQA